MVLGPRLKRLEPRGGLAHRCDNARTGRSSRATGRSSEEHSWLFVSAFSRRRHRGRRRLASPLVVGVP